MEIVIEVSTLIIIAAVALTIGVVVFMKYKGLDSVVDSMVKTFEDLLDEYGEEIKRKDPELYLESMNTMCALKDMAEDDITFVEVVKYATASSKLFKRIMDLYGIDKELRDRIGK